MFWRVGGVPVFLQPVRILLAWLEDTSGFGTVGGFGWVILDLLDQQSVKHGFEGAANGNIDEPADAVIDQRRNWRRRPQIFPEDSEELCLHLQGNEASRSTGQQPWWQEALSVWPKQMMVSVKGKVRHPPVHSSGTETVRLIAGRSLPSLQETETVSHTGPRSWF